LGGCCPSQRVGKQREETNGMGVVCMANCLLTTTSQQ
jgi:hypothetical protein